MSDYWSVFFFYFYVSAKALVVWCLVLRVFLLPQVPFSMRPGWSQEWDAPQVHDWISWTSQWSGQIIIFHRPGFPWNKGISLTKPPFGVRSCEVAIIWPEWWKSKKIAVQHFLLRTTARTPKKVSMDLWDRNFTADVAILSFWMFDSNLLKLLSYF